MNRIASPARAAAQVEGTANPVLVEATRGGHVESWHRGRVAVVAADGRPVMALGDTAAPVFPRSAIKFIQALPLIESGAADVHGVSSLELALACASHGGEPMHTAAVEAWLARLGLSETDLECGPHPPVHSPAAEVLVRSGLAPGRLHNNCSGKHTGFLTVARHIGAPTAGYSTPEHPVQHLVAAAIRDLTGADPDTAPVAIDGCGVPTWAVPIAGLALGMARFADPVGLAPGRQAAIRRLCAAIAANPMMVAGTDRLCTAVAAASAGEVLVKTGAEGVYVAAVPRRGLGFALKIDDGARRAAEVAILALLRRFKALDRSTLAGLADFAEPAITNTQGRRVGHFRAAEALNA